MHFSAAAHLIASARLATDRRLVPSPAIADAGRQRNICHSLKTASTPAAAGPQIRDRTNRDRGAVATMKALAKSLWAATATPATSYSRLDGDVAADCVIVGGGFTGLSTALHLADRGLKTVLVEANEPGWGASGRNGGQVIPGLKLDPSEMRARYGEERGRRLTATVGATADLVFDLIDLHGIECNARRSGWIQGAPGPKGFAEVRRRAEEWAALGADVGVLDRDEVRARVGGGDYVGAYLDRRGGTINPLSYARGLARAAAAAGAAIHGDSPAIALERVAPALESVDPRRQPNGVACRAVHQRLH